MIAHMGCIGLGQNFRKKTLDWIGSEIDWIGLGCIKKIGPMSNSVLLLPIDHSSTGDVGPPRGLRDKGLSGGLQFPR